MKYFKPVMTFFIFGTDSRFYIHYTLNHFIFN